MEENSYQIAGLLKIGKLEHLELLRSMGSIYSNTIKHYRELEEDENDPLRKDTREGATSSINAENLEMSVEDVKLPMNFTKAILNTFDEKTDNTNIFCTYMYSSEDATRRAFIDEAVLKLGDHALLIDDALEFIARVKKAVNGEYPVDYCKVAYYSEKENHENLSVYHKQDVYDYQKEFRFCFDAKVAGPLEFNIGSIDDISQLLKAEDLPTLTLKLNGV